MIALLVKKVSDDKEVVSTQIFDTSGLSSEQLAGFIFVDFIPEPEKNGKPFSLCRKPSTGELYYEYSDPLPQPDIEQLKAQNAAMLLALVNGGLM